MRHAAPTVLGVTHLLAGVSWGAMAAQIIFGVAFETLPATAVAPLLFTDFFGAHRPGSRAAGHRRNGPEFWLR